MTIKKIYYSFFYLLTVLAPVSACKGIWALSIQMKSKKAAIPEIIIERKFKVLCCNKTFIWTKIRISFCPCKIILPAISNIRYFSRKCFSPIELNIKKILHMGMISHFSCIFVEEWDGHSKITSNWHIIFQQIKSVEGWLDVIPFKEYSDGSQE